MTKDNEDALRCADALDDEFTKGRISNHNGRKAAAHLRRLVAENEAKDALLRQAVEALETSETTVPYEGFGIAHREAIRRHAAIAAAIRQHLNPNT